MRFLAPAEVRISNFAISVMPKVSERKKLLKELEHCAKHIIISTPLGQEDDSDLDEILEISAALKQCRYLHPRVLDFKKRSMADLLWGYSERNFRQETRMSKDSFVRIVRCLEKHPIFENNSHRKQTSAWIQCLVVFRRFGCYGNANSLGSNGRNSGFSEGAIVNFVSRVTTALLSIRKQVIKWPNANERVKIKTRFKNDSGVVGAVGIIDGTPVVLSQRPTIDGEVFWSRKSCYCINLQLVCDDRGLIRWFLTGWPGSVYDNTIFERSQLCTNTNRYFNPGEFIMADSGYALKMHCITPYKQPQASVPYHQQFNELFSSKRVTIEHVNGQLKNRWASLKGIPTQIRNAGDFKRVNDHITSCCVLHNLLKRLNDEWPFEEDDDENNNEDDDENEIQLPEDLNADDSAKNFRTTIENYLLEWYYTNHML